MARLLSVLALLLGAAVLSPTAPAHADAPDKFGFATWDGATEVKKIPVATTINNFAVGRYWVTFPGQGAAGGIAHVTAIDDTGNWCQIERWYQSGANEFVFVRCYGPGNEVLENTRFTVMFSTSSLPMAGTGRYAYVHYSPAGIASQFNSSGAANTVSVNGVGWWKARLSNLPSSTFVGNIQATAVHPKAARCKVANWATGFDQLIDVRCFDWQGLPVNTAWTLSYHVQRKVYGNDGQRIGYLWNRPPINIGQTNFKSFPAPAINLNTVMHNPPGTYIVTMPQLASPLDHVQVTASGTSNGYCGLSAIWLQNGQDVIIRSVICFVPPFGNRADSGFFLSYASLY